MFLVYRGASTLQGAWHYSPPMNRLHVGTNKTFDDPPVPFLLIDDGEVIDTLTLPTRRKIHVLDLSKDSFNPLKDIDHKRARALAEIIYAASPQGQSTLTVRNGKRALARLVLETEWLEKLPLSHPKLTPEAIDEAHAAVHDLFLSPLLKRFLTHRTTFSFDSVLIARLNRAELGRFDSFVIGNLLMSRYPGQVVVPDFGFYAGGQPLPFHLDLIEQGRLIAGLNNLSEVPLELRQALLGMEKVGQHCTHDDAVVLAEYTGLLPHTNGYNEFIEEVMA